ncbi:MAG: LpxI family protein, partial [Candidatus Omnitrophica bacterium]|nr:LpxI family protein [Candidatus Omnitrophota bacterium]
DCSVVGLESLEGTDRTIKRSYRLAGQNCLVLKFCKSNQDLRFDVPVVGISTLRLLKNIKAAGLVLEKDKVIILEKSKFISLARKWKIPVIGKERIT